MGVGDADSGFSSWSSSSSSQEPIYGDYSLGIRSVLELTGPVILRFRVSVMEFMGRSVLKER